MNIIKRVQINGGWAALGVLLAAAGIHRAHAYETYTDCMTCHGDFLDNTSPKGTTFPSNSKHEMHRASSSMGTACNLCHFGSSRTPVYTFKSNATANNQGLGCSGCHEGNGLRLHHYNNGITECQDCHTLVTAPAETVKPPYYGTPDTKARNPENTAKVANTNENWSVGDFLGLDNDGNNLYDLADYAVGPYRLLSATGEGNNLRVTWLTAGGRTNIVQAANSPTGPYADVSAPIGIPGVGIATNSYLDPGAATNRTRYYRMKATVQ